MKTIPNNAPTNVAALDERDPNAGNAHHTYGIQFGGPKDMLRIQFQHGPRGVESSTPGVFDDDLLAIIQDRLEGYQSGPFVTAETQTALEHIRAAREALGLRVARRIAQGVLGANEKHDVPPPPSASPVVPVDVNDVCAWCGHERIFHMLRDKFHNGACAHDERPNSKYRCACGKFVEPVPHVVPPPTSEQHDYTDEGEVELSPEDAARFDAAIDQAEKDIAAMRGTCVDCRHRHWSGVRCGEDVGPSVVGDRVTCGCASKRMLASGAR